MYPEVDDIPDQNPEDQLRDDPEFQGFDEFIKRRKGVQAHLGMALSTPPPQVQPEPYDSTIYPIPLPLVLVGTPAPQPAEKIPLGRPTDLTYKELLPEEDVTNMDTQSGRDVANLKVFGGTKTVQDLRDFTGYMGSIQQKLSKAYAADAQKNDVPEVYAQAIAGGALLPEYQQLTERKTIADEANLLATSSTPPGLTPKPGEEYVGPVERFEKPNLVQKVVDFFQPLASKTFVTAPEYRAKQIKDLTQQIDLDKSNYMWLGDIANKVDRGEKLNILQSAYAEIAIPAFREVVNNITLRGADKQLRQLLPSVTPEATVTKISESLGATAGFLMGLAPLAGGLAAPGWEAVGAKVAALSGAESPGLVGKLAARAIQGGGQLATTGMIQELPSVMAEGGSGGEQAQAMAKAALRYGKIGALWSMAGLISFEQHPILSKIIRAASIRAAAYAGGKLDPSLDFVNGLTDTDIPIQERVANEFLALYFGWKGENDPEGLRIGAHLRAPGYVKSEWMKTEGRSPTAEEVRDGGGFWRMAEDIDARKTVNVYWNQMYGKDITKDEVNGYGGILNTFKEVATRVYAMANPETHEASVDSEGNIIYTKTADKEGMPVFQEIPAVEEMKLEAANPEERPEMVEKKLRQFELRNKIVSGTAQGEDVSNYENELYLDPISKGRNDVFWNENIVPSNPKFVGSIDLLDADAINKYFLMDHGAEQLGVQLLANNLGEDNVARINPNENMLTIWGDDPSQLHARLEEARQLLEAQGFNTAYGTGKSLDESQLAIDTDRKVRQKAGEKSKVGIIDILYKEYGKWERGEMDPNVANGPNPMISFWSSPNISFVSDATKERLKNMTGYIRSEDAAVRVGKQIAHEVLAGIPSWSMKANFVHQRLDYSEENIRRNTRNLLMTNKRDMFKEVLNEGSIFQQLLGRWISGNKHFTASIRPSYDPLISWALEKDVTCFGYYDPGPDVLLINPNVGQEEMRHTIIHEGIHAITSSKWPFLSQSQLGPLEKLVRAASRWWDIHYSGGDKPYGFRNSREFLAEFLTDSDMQMVLTDMPYRGHKIKDKNAYDSTVSLIGDFFFDNPDWDKNTKLRAAFDIAIRLTNEQPNYSKNPFKATVPPPSMVGPDPATSWLIEWPSGIKDFMLKTDPSETPEQASDRYYQTCIRRNQSDGQGHQYIGLDQSVEDWMAQGGRGLPIGPDLTDTNTADMNALVSGQLGSYKAIIATGAWPDLAWDPTRSGNPKQTATLADKIGEKIRWEPTRESNNTFIEKFNDFVVDKFKGLPSGEVRTFPIAIHIGTDEPMSETNQPVFKHIVSKTDKDLRSSIISGAYSGEIKSMEPDMVKRVNELGGLPIKVSGPIDTRDTDTITKVMADAKAQGLHLQVEARNMDSVKSFANEPGVSITVTTDTWPDYLDDMAKEGRASMEKNPIYRPPTNKEFGLPDRKIDARVAIDGYLSDAKKAMDKLSKDFTMDADKFDLATVLQWKERQPGMKINYVATNRNELIKAISDPRIDVVSYVGEAKSFKDKSDFIEHNHPGVSTDGVSPYRSLFEHYAFSAETGDVTQAELDNVVGKGVISREDFNSEALRKFHDKKSVPDAMMDEDVRSAKIAKAIGIKINRLDDAFRDTGEMTNSKSLGMRTAAVIADGHNRDGGSTYNLQKGDLSGTDNFSVGIFPHKTKGLPNKTITEGDVYSFIRDNLDSFKRHPELSVGTFWNDARKESQLDVALTIPNRALAIKIGTMTGQDSIYDLKTGTVIPCPKRKSIQIIRLSHGDHGSEMVVDPKFMGTGESGEEDRTQRDSRGKLLPGYLNKSSWYSPTSRLIESHRFMNTYAYSADIPKDRLLIVKRGKDVPRDIDIKTRQAGKLGWFDENSGQARMIDKIKAQYIGKPDLKPGDRMTGFEMWQQLQGPTPGSNRVDAMAADKMKFDKAGKLRDFMKFMDQQRGIPPKPEIDMPTTVETPEEKTARSIGEFAKSMKDRPLDLNTVLPSDAEAGLPAAKDSNPPAGAVPPSKSDKPNLLFSINLNLSSPEDAIKKNIEDTLRLHEDKLKKVRGNPQPDDVVKELAKIHGLKIPLETLLSENYRRTQSLNVSLYDARCRINDVHLEIDSAYEAWKKEPTPANEAKYLYLKELGTKAILMATFSAREMGRGLRSFGFMAKAQGFLLTGAYERALKMLRRSGHDDPDTVKKMMMVDPNNPSELIKFLQDQVQPSLHQKIYEFWVNMLLSSPVTHATNAISNAINVAMLPIETSLSSIYSKAGGIVNDGWKDAIMAGEAPHQIMGFLAGVWPGLKVAWRDIKHEYSPVTDVTKMELQRLPAIKGVKGEAIRMPGRFLKASDEMFKTFIYSMDLHGQAYRQAAIEKKQGKITDVGARMRDLIQDTPQHIVDHARNAALYHTFNDKLEGAAKEVSNMRNQYPALGYIFPFVRTPYNIVTYALERTPLAAASIAKKFASIPINKLFGTHLSGWDSVSPEEASHILGRATMGSIMAMGIAQMVASGNITGSIPYDPEERAAFYRAGKQPRSIKIMGKWYSYGRLQPIGIIMGTIADTYDLIRSGRTNAEESNKLVGKIALVIGQNITDNTFLRGAHDLAAAVIDPEQYGINWLQQMEGSIVPTGLAEMARDVDPVVREIHTTMDLFKSRIPFASRSLPPKVDEAGRIVTRPKALWGAHMVSPVKVSEANTSPVEEELRRLDIFPGKIPKKIGKEVMNPYEYAGMAQKVGQATWGKIAQIIRAPSWSRITDEAKKKILLNVIRQTRSDMRAPYKVEYESHRQPNTP